MEASHGAGKSITEPAREVPVTGEVDVLVVGGGYAGCAAAVCAARNGARTLLVEQQGGGGGRGALGYGGLTFSYIEGVGYELFDRLERRGALKGRFVDPEKTKLVLEQMLLAEGVEILYCTTVVDSIVEDRVMKGVIVHNKSGRGAILARRVIDASGDGDVSAYAGVPFEVGSPEHENYNQASSLVCRIGNVDMEEYRGTDTPMMRTWLESVERAVEAGEFPYMIDKRINWFVVVPGRDKKHQEVFICYAHSRNCRCLDAADLSRQLIEQREQTALFIEFCRKYIPGFGNAWLIDTAPMLGVRDSRRIMCEYKLTAEDLVEGRRFDDAIMRGMHTFDAHHPTDVGHIKHIVKKNADGSEEKLYVDPGSWREIPYRAIVPLEIDNLLVAGRNFSADFMAQSGNRLVMECFNMGQAAGAAAALSIRDDVSPRKLDVGRLQSRLVEMGLKLRGDPKYGAARLSTGAKLKKEDLEFPEASTTAVETTVIREDRAAGYRFHTREEEVTEVRQAMAATRTQGDGYTDTGGDVGTNLE